MKTLKTAPDSHRLINRMITGNILFGIVLAVLVFGFPACDEAFADDVPPIPPIDQRVGWEINQLPANLTAKFSKGLQVAYAIAWSTPVKYEEAFREGEAGQFWYFRSACTVNEIAVRTTPTAYRLGDNHPWLPYIQSTYRW